MKFYVGVTDSDWYKQLSNKGYDEVNFWQPGGRSAFKILNPGDPFLFKLRGPNNPIGGMGFFYHHTNIHYQLAWDSFEEKNGVNSIEEFKKRIVNYRNSSNQLDINP